MLFRFFGCCARTLGQILVKLGGFLDIHLPQHPKKIARIGPQRAEKLDAATAINKINLTVCLFTHSKGIKIGPSCQELRGVSKLPLAMNNPVERN